MEVHYNKYCQKCTGKVVMHAFSEGECTLCSSVISTSHTPCDKVCDKCSDAKGVCMSCGELLKEVKRTIKYFRGAEKTPDNIESITTEMKLTANEILNQYKDYLDPTTEELLLGQVSRHIAQDGEYKAKGTWEDVLRYAENMGKEKQILEALILSFRVNLQKRRDSHFEKKTGSATAITSVMLEFDKHFNINKQRQGKNDI